MKKNNMFKYIVMVLCCAMLMIACKEIEPEGGGLLETTTPMPSDIPPPAEPDTEVPSVTQPEVSPEPDITVTESPDQSEGISYESALGTLRSLIPESKYDIVSVDKEFSKDGKEYYMFQVTQNDRAIEPFIIVDKKESAVYYYGDGGKTSEFTHFPLDTTEVIIPDSDADTDDVIKKIASISKEKLGLTKELNQYETEIDTWTTLVEGEQCYGVNVFDKKDGKRQLIAMFYVSADGDAVYRLDDENTFIKIAE